MNVENILAELKQQLNRIEGAITAIQSLGGTKPSGKRGHRTMSADARHRIGLAMKKRWAERKGKKAASKKARKGGISAAGRKRISEMMKQRWAKKKKAQGVQA
jgi:hypothetical protein